VNTLKYCEKIIRQKDLALAPVMPYLGNSVFTKRGTMTKLIFIIAVCTLSTHNAFAETPDMIDPHFFELNGVYTLNPDRSDLSCIGYLRDSSYPRDVVPTLTLRVGPGVASAYFEISEKTGLPQSMEVQFAQIDGLAEPESVDLPQKNKKVHRKLLAAWDPYKRILFDRFERRGEKNIHEFKLQDDGSVRYSGRLFDDQTESCVFTRNRPPSETMF